MADFQPLSSPKLGVGARRKSSKTLPKLPLSAFTPPNSGTGEKFPLPPSPSTVHPDSVIDTHVIAKGGDLAQWKSEAGQVLGGRISGVVLSLQTEKTEDVEKAVERVQASSYSLPILSLLVPFSLVEGVPASPPTYITGSSKVPIALLSPFVQTTPQYAEGVKWALEKGYIVELEVQSQSDFQNSDAWESLEELVSKALEGYNGSGAIVVSNILPPPHTLTVPIVKLLTHPSYRAYQAHLAQLSLFPSVSVKVRPPLWGSPTPKTPPVPESLTSPSEETPTQDVKNAREWKRRIKMYLGPAIEAFGYNRILFGSAPSLESQEDSNAGDWYELARESFAELGIEQEGIDAVFGGNAKTLYSTA